MNRVIVRDKRDLKVGQRAVLVRGSGEESIGTIMYGRVVDCKGNKCGVRDEYTLVFDNCSENGFSHIGALGSMQLELNNIYLLKDETSKNKNSKSVRVKNMEKEIKKQKLVKMNNVKELSNGQRVLFKAMHLDDPIFATIAFGKAIDVDGDIVNMDGKYGIIYDCKQSEFETWYGWLDNGDFTRNEIYLIVEE